MKHVSVLQMFKNFTDLLTHMLVNKYFYNLFRAFYTAK